MVAFCEKTYTGITEEVPSMNHETLHLNSEACGPQGRKIMKKNNEQKVKSILDIAQPETMDEALYVEFINALALMQSGR